MLIEENTFAMACIRQNSVLELRHALAHPADRMDMALWELSAKEWREQVELALSVMNDLYEQ